MENSEIKSKLKKPVERSAAYPAVNLEEAIKLAKKVKEALGGGPYNRASVVIGMGYPSVSGASAPKVAALVHYGLFTRINDIYRLSPLADRILIETSDEDKRLAVLEALQTPTLFRNLIEKYQGSALPTLLKNILVRDYKIIEKVAPEVVKIFQESLEFAGILKNGVVLNEGVGNFSQNTQLAEQPNPGKPHDILRNGFKRGNFHETPPLPSGLIILFPESLASDFALGELSTEIKNLDKKAQELLDAKKVEEEEKVND